MIDPVRRSEAVSPSRTGDEMTDAPLPLAARPGDRAVPAGTERSRAAAMKVIGMPAVAITSSLDGAFEIVGSGLRAPANTFWQKLLDTLLEIFSAGFAQTRTYDDAVDAGYWRHCALALAFARAALRPNDPAVFPSLSDKDNLLRKLRSAIAAANRDEEGLNLDAVIAQLDATLTAVSEVRPQDLLLLNQLAADPQFSKRAELVAMLAEPEWAALRPVIASDRFRRANDPQRREMLAKLVASFDVNAAVLEKPTIDAVMLAQRRQPSPYTMSAPVAVGEHAFYVRPPSYLNATAMRLDVRFAEGAVPVFYPTQGYDAGDHMHAITSIANALALLPAQLRRQIVRLDLSPGHYAFASATGAGVVTMYALDREIMKTGFQLGEALNFGVAPVLAVVLAHELGHVVTLNISDDLSDEEVRARYREAAAEDLSRTTHYGLTNEIEEMAEVFATYVFVLGTADEWRYRKLWGGRFAFFDWLMTKTAQRRALGDE